MNELVALLEQHGVIVHQGDRQTRPGWINMKCPFCGKDPYLGINMTGLYASCWSCGYTRLEDVLQVVTGWKLRQCWEFVRSLRGSLPTLCAPLRTGELCLPPGAGPILGPHLEYLGQRGFHTPRQVVQDWDLGGIGADGGHLKWRILIPIHYHGKVVSWTTRAIGGREPRYYTAADKDSIISPTQLCYGMDHVRNSVVVVEGPVDVWAIGFGAVALLGQTVNSARLEQLSRIPLRVICFDNEPAAQVRARQLADNLSIYGGVTTNMVLRTGKDPASASTREVQKLREYLQ